MQGYKRELKPGTWKLEVYLGRDPLTGKKRYTSKTFHGKKRAAETELARFVASTETQRAPDTEGTVAYLLETWMRLVKRDRSPTTHQGYRYIADFIITEIGAVKLCDLTPHRIDALYQRAGERLSRVTGEPISPNTVLAVHAVLRRALNMAVRWGWLDQNPVRRANPPSRVKGEKRTPKIEAYTTMLVAADEMDIDLGVLIRLAAASGCRRGELCGFRWVDVNWAAKAITVHRSIAVVKDPSTPGKRRLVVKDPKTHQVRTITLDDFMMKILFEHRERAEARAQLDADGLVEEAYIFSHEPDGSQPLQPPWVTDAFSRVRAEAGMEKIVLHGLRHLSASLQLAAGVPLPVVQGRLGHESQQTTFGYTHALPGADQQAAAALGALLNQPA